ncbi:MAG: type II toxin-antitoxin system RelE/ParE family toxin [Pyrinomonadaceae bacterium]
MKTYQLEFSKEAIADLDTSFEWGCEKWGTEEAADWYFDFRESITKRLGSFPLGQPIAPENDEYDVEARQLIIGRYSVIFNVNGNVVTILHIRGPY